MLVSFSVAANAWAVPIISEPFNYVGDGLSLLGRSGAGKIGWNTQWNVAVDPLINTGSVTVEPGSLVLGTYATSGNRIRSSASGGSAAPASSDYVTFARPAGVDVGVVGGEMWQSFLYKRIDNTFNGFDTVNNVGDGIQDDFVNSTNFELRIRPKRQNVDGL
ncbi:MAG: hypothetical protein GXP26_01770 [Planctomycetes bacterium]|nr:hypothetical protein [Planctomycetota bacterium]